MWTLTLPALGIFVMYMIYLTIIGYRLGEKIWGERPEISMEHSEKIHETTTLKKNLMILFLIMMIFYISQS